MQFKLHVLIDCDDDDGEHGLGVAMTMLDVVNMLSMMTMSGIRLMPTKMTMISN